MDKAKRKTLLEEYKKIKTHMGIVQIKNLQNGKIHISVCANLKNRWLSLKHQLDSGRFPSRELQRDYKDLGEEAFTYEVLEEKDTEGVNDVKWELSQMEKKWLEKLQPFGEKGYNKKKV